VVVVYQAVPAPVDPPGAAAQIVLVIDVPIGLEAAAGEAIRLADDFGMTISHWLPGVRAQKAVMSARTEPPHRDSADPQTQPQPQTGLMIDLANRRVTVDGQQWLPLRSRCRRPVPHGRITPTRELATRAIEYCPHKRRVT
jgi:hypothetical protein